MPVNKKQLLRLVRLVGELKENRYPNCKSFAEKLRILDLQENLPLTCTPKTIQRDIRTLKEDFNAPIEFDSERNGYYLSHHGWNFQCPLFEEQEMLASILGAKVAEDIFPDPIRNDIRYAADTILTENNPDFLDSAYIHSLIIASGLKVAIDPDIFRTIFEAWKKHKCVNISYNGMSGESTERVVEPHVLAFNEAAWFIKGYCMKRNAVRTFALHRIVAAETMDEEFEPDQEIIGEVKSGLLFDYKKINNINIECDGSIAAYLAEKPLHSMQKIEEIEEGKYSISVPSASEFELINWIISQQGRAVLQKPIALRNKVAKTAKAILDVHR